MSSYKALFFNIIMIFLFTSCSQGDLWTNSNKEIDETPPLIFSEDIIATNNTTLELHFIEEVEKTSAENTANYTITNTIDNTTVTVDTAILNDADNSIVTLTTDPHNLGDYEILIENISDKFENAINPGSEAIPYDYDPMPYIVSASAMSNTKVIVVFSEDIFPAVGESAFLPGNFAIVDTSSNALVVSDASYYNGNSRQILITTDPQCPPDGTAVSYSLTVNGITDETDNVIDGWALLNDTQRQESFSGHPLPYVVSASSVSNESIEVIFSEPVNISTSAVLTVTDKDSNTLTLSSMATLDNITYSFVTTSQTSASYTFVASGVTDIASLEFQDSIDSWDNAPFNYPENRQFAFDSSLYIISTEAIANMRVECQFTRDVIFGADPYVTIYDITNSVSFDADVAFDLTDPNSTLATSKTVYLLLPAAYESGEYMITAANDITDSLGNEVKLDDLNQDVKFTGSKNPCILEVTYVSATSITVKFSKSMGSSAEEEPYYFIDSGSLINPDLATFVLLTDNQVLLTLTSSPVAISGNYKLYVTDIFAVDGSSMGKPAYMGFTVP